MSLSCCVFGCYNRAARGRKSLYRQSDSVTYHPLPIGKIARRNWLNALEIDDSRRQSAHDLYVCSRHFKPRDFLNKKLKPNAVPHVDRKKVDDWSTIVKDCRVLISAEDRKLAESRLKPKIDRIVEIPSPVSSPPSANFVIKSSLCSKADMREIRKSPLSPSTVWRVIVPAPPSGQLNSENFIKSIVSKIPELKTTVNSTTKSRKLVITEKLGAASKNVIPTKGDSPMKGTKKELPLQIASYCSLREPNSTIGRVKNVLDAKEAYVRKIRTLQQIKRRMNCRIVELTKRIQTLQEVQCHSSGCKTVEHIIVIEASPKCGCSSTVDNQETATVPVEDLETVLKTAVDKNVPPPLESRRLVTEREKLLKKIVSIKKGMKKKDIVRCVFIEAEEIT